MFKSIKNLEAEFSLSKAAAIIAIFTIASRLFGLLRTRLFTSTFGAGDTLDVYYASFRIPDFVANLLVLGTLSIAFVPVFSEFLVKDKKQGERLASTTLTAVSLAMLVICSLLIYFTPELTSWLLPGFTGQKYIDTVY